jgi:antirestriction protein ArdC
MSKGFGSAQWATYKQWIDAGEQVAKGSKGTQIIYFKMNKYEDKKTGKEETYPMMRVYTVFNRAQLDNYEADTGNGESFNHVQADQWIQNTGAKIVHAESQAYYNPSADEINMPPMGEFIEIQGATAEQGYYGTLFHELTHWTGAERRLDRLRKVSDRQDYAFEELVAEIGACFQSVMFGIETTPRADHAKYLNGWIESLENDDGLIFKASAKASKAFDYLEDLQEAEQPAAATG